MDAKKQKKGRGKPRPFRSAALLLRGVFPVPRLAAPVRVDPLEDVVLRKADVRLDLHVGYETLLHVGIDRLHVYFQERLKLPGGEHLGDAGGSSARALGFS